MRKYSNKTENLCMYALGDGTAVVALNGLDIYGIKGADLAGRFCLRGYVQESSLVEAESFRLPGRFRYRHTIQKNGKPIGSMEEYFSTGHSFVREFSLTEPLCLVLEPDRLAVCAGEGVYAIAKGSHYVNDYPTGKTAYFSVFLNGRPVSQTDGKLCCMLRGNDRLTIRFGDTPQAVVPEQTVWEYNLPCPVSTHGEMGQLLEDYWYCYCSHHSQTGGTISHVLWNLNYVRDNYGMSRGLLAMGLYEDAKTQLKYYWDFWSRNGKLATAQSVGCDGTMHIHECDEAENPGYLVLEAFDYYEATADRAFLERLLPMLRWAVQVQAKHLYQGMMPFCGDETYVAGNILPRVDLEHGSCEATMLFIESVKRMTPYGLPEKTVEAAKEAAERFQDNFWRNGGLITNNPARKTAPLPPVKKGPCVFCYRYMDGLKPNRFGLYTCPACAQRPEDISSDAIYTLSCVELVPAYLHTGLLTKQQQYEIYDRIAKHLLETGCFGTQGQDKKNTGYEFGLLLYGLVKTENPLQHPVRELVMARRNEIGLWDEYYDLQGNPGGMRYRLWESGVNVMALVAYDQANASVKGDLT